MTDPRIPRLMAITLDASGVANSSVIANNLTNGNRLIRDTDAGKIVIFDVAEFTDAYSNGDIISFENVGASHGGTTITLNTAIGLQEATITCAASPTNQIII